MPSCNLIRIANACAKRVGVIDERTDVVLMTTLRMKRIWPNAGICHGLILDPKPSGKPYVIVVNYDFYRKNRGNCALLKELFLHELLHVKLKSRSHGSRFITACNKLGIKPLDYTVPYREM